MAVIKQQHKRKRCKGLLMVLRLILASEHLQKFQISQVQVEQNNAFTGNTGNVLTGKFLSRQFGRCSQCPPWGWGTSVCWGVCPAFGRAFGSSYSCLGRGQVLLTVEVTSVLVKLSHPKDCRGFRLLEILKNAGFHPVWIKTTLKIKSHDLSFFGWLCLLPVHIALHATGSLPWTEVKDI